MLFAILQTEIFSSNLKMNKRKKIVDLKRRAAILSIRITSLLIKFNNLLKIFKIVKDLLQLFLLWKNNQLINRNTLKKSTFMNI